MLWPWVGPLASHQALNLSNTMSTGEDLSGVCAGVSSCPVSPYDLLNWEGSGEEAAPLSGVTHYRG